MTESEPVLCDRCAADRAAEPDPSRRLAWVREREAELIRWLCPPCARRHTRDIEAKLPTSYW